MPVNARSPQKISFWIASDLAHKRTAVLRASYIIYLCDSVAERLV